MLNCVLVLVITLVRVRLLFASMTTVSAARPTPFALREGRTRQAGQASGIEGVCTASGSYRDKCVDDPNTQTHRCQLFRRRCR
jgi:hypothetical protein